MKALNILTSLMMLSVLFLGCEQDGLSPIEPTDSTQKYFEGYLTIDAIGGTPTGSTLSMSPLDLRFTGEGHSNLFSEINLESSHEQLYGDDPSSYAIESGEFKMMIKSGDELFGIYDGFGIIQNGQIAIVENYQILGGTGILHNASGNLSVQSYQIPDCSSRNATMFGTIVLDELKDISKF
jgi:hypothetical protein